MLGFQSHQRRRSLIPLSPGGPAGGYDNGSALPGPVAPASGGRFQQTIDQQRALNQRSAATFAAAAPLPTATAATPSTIGTKTAEDPALRALTPPTPGQYNGAQAPAGYKPGTELKASDGSSIPLSPISPQAAQQTAQAARSAFVQRNNDAANLGTGGFFHAQGLKDDWNARENAQTGAGVAESGARTGFLGAQRAQTEQLTPTMVRQGDATAALTTSQARANDAGVPGMAASLDELKKSHGELQKRHDALLARLAAYGDKDATREAAAAKSKAELDAKGKTHEGDLKFKAEQNELDRKAALERRKVGAVVVP